MTTSDTLFAPTKTPRANGKSPLDAASYETRLNSVDFTGRVLRYSVVTRTQVCRHCNSYHSTNQVNAVIQGPRHLLIRPVGRFEYDVPVEIVHEETQYLPACRLCADTVRLAHLPPPQPSPTPKELGVRAKWRIVEGVAKREEKGKPITSEDLF